MTAVRCSYWDASALVKIVVDETGSSAARAAFFRGANDFATSYCVAEAINVLKRKWVKDGVPREDYFRSVREFFRLVVSHVREDQVPISLQVLEQAERVMAAHEVDFVDAIQLVTVLSGRYSVLVGESASLFITADKDLAMAGRKLGAKVWRCDTEPYPT